MTERAKFISPSSLIVLGIIGENDKGLGAVSEEKN
jgi:hypothetical protein